MMEAPKEYKHVETREITKWLLILLKANILVLLFALYSNYMEAQLLHSIEDESYLSEEQLEIDITTNNDTQGVVGIVQVVLFIVIGVLFLKWIYRTNNNLHARGILGLKFSPKESVSYYFYPIKNLYMPFRSMEEIWKATFTKENWEDGKTPFFLSIWWILWIGSNGFGYFLFKTSNRAETIGDFIATNSLTTISDLLDIPLNIIVIILITKLSQAHNSIVDSEWKGPEYS